MPEQKNELNFLGGGGDVSYSKQGTPAAELSEAFVGYLLPFVLKTPVFKMLSRLQRTLDALDIEGLFGLYALCQPSASNPPLEKMFPDPTIDDWEHFVDTYLDNSFQSTLNSERPDAKQLHYYTMAFLMSASFKDCSVIIRSPKADEVPNSITVIDLDPKGMDRLRKWYDLDRKLGTSFEDDAQKRCIDANNLNGTDGQEQRSAM